MCTSVLMSCMPAEACQRLELLRRSEPFALVTVHVARPTHLHPLRERAVGKELDGIAHDQMAGVLRRQPGDAFERFGGQPQCHAQRKDVRRIARPRRCAWSNAWASTAVSTAQFEPVDMSATVVIPPACRTCNVLRILSATAAGGSR